MYFSSIDLRSRHCRQTVSKICDGIFFSFSAESMSHKYPLSIYLDALTHLFFFSLSLSLFSLFLSSLLTRIRNSKSGINFEQLSTVRRMLFSMQYAERMFCSDVYVGVDSVSEGIEYFYI